jgi:hypothetical protein
MVYGRLVERPLRRVPQVVAGLLGEVLWEFVLGPEL